MGLSSSLSAMTNPQTFQSDLNNIMNNTTIKRACCVKNTDDDNPDVYKINVKIPVPNDYDFSNIQGEPQMLALQQKLGYIDKEVKVPKSLCNSLSSDKCDDFMFLYCNNAKQIFKNDINLAGSVFSNDEFLIYAKDCGCFNDPPEFMKNKNMSGLPKTCYLNGCDPNNSGVYLDKVSREKPCNTTICSTIFNAENIKAGGSASLNNNVVQNCGEQIASAKTQIAEDEMKDKINKLANTQVDTQPSTIDNKPVDTQPSTIDNKPVDTQPSTIDNKPVDTQPSTIDNKPVDTSSSNKPSNTQSRGINKYFTSEENYIGYIILFIIIIVICLCCSTSLFIINKK
jgi:hypothetical protein